MADGAFTVLGIDPGTLVTGYGIVAQMGPEIRLVGCGTIKSTSAQPLPFRLKAIYAGLYSLIDRFHPDVCAIESAFYGKNAQSAMKLGHARGVSILAAVQHDIPTAEYSPREVKKAITGRGTASKEQVQYMVKSVLQSGTRAMVLDASDALAVAICHLHRFTAPSLKHKDWKSFIDAHPERVKR